MVDQQEDDAAFVVEEEEEEVAIEDAVSFSIASRKLALN